jgi:DNA-binding GntR family transcriptional regulator
MTTTGAARNRTGEPVDPLPRKTFVPLYSQLARLIEQRIESNEYAPGSRLPNENDLATQHGVSVITVRGALKVLIERGRVERFAGKGTFVLAKRPLRAAWGLGSIADIDLTTTASEMTMLASGMPTPPPWILEAFGCKPGTTLPWMRNTRAVQGERFMVSDVYHHPDLGSLVRGAPFKTLLRERKLVVMALCEIAGMTLGEIRQSLTASLAGEDMAQTLQIPVGEPLLVVDRVFISDDERVIQVGRSHYRVDHYRYDLNLRPIEQAHAAATSGRRRLLQPMAAGTAPANP